jgi:hypothetical protein
MTPDESISAREAAGLLVTMLEAHAWVFSLTVQGELHLVVGDDDPPRWPQAKLLAVLGAMTPVVIMFLAARDGLEGVDGGGVVH